MNQYKLYERFYESEIFGKQVINRLLIHDLNKFDEKKFVQNHKQFVRWTSDYNLIDDE